MRPGVAAMLMLVIAASCAGCGATAEGQPQPVMEEQKLHSRPIIAFDCNRTSEEHGVIPSDFEKCRTKKRIKEEFLSTDLLILKKRKVIRASAIVCKIKMSLGIFYCSGCNLVQTCTQPMQEVHIDVELDYAQCSSLYHNNTIVLRDMLQYGNPTDTLEVQFQDSRREVIINARGERDSKGFCEGESFYMLNEKYLRDYILEISVSVDTSRAHAEIHYDEGLIFINKAYMFRNYSGQMALMHNDLGTVILEKEHDCASQFQGFYFNDSKVYETEDSTLVVRDNNNQTFIFQMFAEVEQCGQFILRQTGYREVFLCIRCNREFESIDLINEALIVELRIASESRNYIQGEQLNRNFLQITDQICAMNTWLANLHWESYLDKELDTPHGLIGQKKGDVIYFRKCKEIQVWAGGHNGCYQDLQVTFEGVNYFLSKRTAILKDNSTKIECNSDKMAKYKVRDVSGAIMHICEFPRFYDCPQPHKGFVERIALSDVNEVRIPYLFADEHYSLSVLNEMRRAENLFSQGNVSYSSKDAAGKEIKELYDRDLNIFSFKNLAMEVIKMVPGFSFLMNLQFLGLRPMEIYGIVNLIIYVVCKIFLQNALMSGNNMLARPACGSFQLIKMIIFLAVPALFAAEQRQAPASQV